MKMPRIFAAVAVSVIALAAQAEINVVPYPTSVTENPGAFKCPADKELKDVVKFSKDASIPKEGYRLSVTESGIEVASSDKAGEFYALQTLDQLKGASIPCVEIVDAPRFKWRGVHVDDVRHFIGKEQAKRTIDQIAKYKFNVFHWHLTDNEAWRIEVPGYPKLTEKGAFYTKDDIREVVAYAAERHIKVVPEVDFPGHFRKLSNVYPELSCTTDDPSEKGRAPMCVGNPDAVKFVEAALDAVCDLFPESDIIHIGGDECAQVIWTKCEKCKAMMAREGIEKPHDLQAWITRHAVKHLAAKGRRAIGWDEMLDAKDGYLPTSTMGMRWHDKGAERTARAAAAGHEIVNCHKRFCYFDYPQGIEGDKLRYFGRGRPHEIVTIEKVYSFDPLAELPVESHSKVIGGQCNNWSERTYNGKNLEWKLWPRALALSEVLWTYPDPKKRDFEGFKRRAEVRREALVASGVNAAPIK